MPLLWILMMSAILIFGNTSAPVAKATPCAAVRTAIVLSFSTGPKCMFWALWVLISLFCYMPFGRPAPA